LWLWMPWVRTPPFSLIYLPVELRLANFVSNKGVSPSGKAQDFDSCIRWFESSHSCIQGFDCSKPSDCQKTLGELERARSPLDFNRAQRHVRWARGYFCVGKSYFPEQKYLPCSFHARKSAGFQWKLSRGGSGGGDSPPSTLVKKTFLTSRRLRLFEAFFVCVLLPHQ
jgi:hypothetical protein